jgi:hypothetical protein
VYGELARAEVPHRHRHVRERLARQDGRKDIRVKPAFDSVRLAASGAGFPRRRRQRHILD